jgi:phosphatidylethanolamine-binding protein (PEBP) family uncharacterized protein
MHRRGFAVVCSVAIIAGAGLAACDTDDGRTMRPPSSEQRAGFTTTTAPPVTEAPLLGITTTIPATTALAVPAALSTPWADGAPIDASYTCDGAGLIPLIQWNAPPAGTAEVAVAITDDDAGGFVHWLVTQIPASTTAIGGTEPQAGVVQANSQGIAGYSALCPPAGETHTYRVALFLFNAPFVVTANDAALNILGDMAGEAPDVVEITGTYQRAA